MLRASEVRERQKIITEGAIQEEFKMLEQKIECGMEQNLTKFTISGTLYSENIIKLREYGYKVYQTTGFCNITNTIVSWDEEKPTLKLFSNM